MENKEKHNLIVKILVGLLAIFVIVIIVMFNMGYISFNSKNSVSVNSNNDNNKETVSIKLNTSKDWVYDADYQKNTLQDSYVISSGDTYYAKDIIVPYININSDDANKVNNEINEILNQMVECYNDGVKTSIGFVAECNYKTMTNGNILSVILTYGLGGSDVVQPVYHTYNFDLTTGKILTYEQIYKIAGLSINNITTKVESSIKTSMPNIFGEDLWNGDTQSFNEDYNASIKNYQTSVSDNSIKYFLDSNKNLNIVVTLEVPVGTGSSDKIITIK